MLSDGYSVKYGARSIHHEVVSNNSNVYCLTRPKSHYYEARAAWPSVLLLVGL